MAAMGIDIGTTTLSLVLVDEGSGALVASRTLAHDAFIDDGCPAGKVQDPVRIWLQLQDCVSDLIAEHGQPSCIGLTGQMHGMLYVDRRGRAISPLYTWQDARSAEPGGDGGPSAVQLLRDAGCAAAPGYGLATHCALIRSGSVPRLAEGMATIADFIGMRLTGASRPALTPDMAASWGGFDLKKRAFQTDALESLGLRPELLPRVDAAYGILGETPAGVPVACALGDNQASVIGSVASPEDTVLINIGTGSQVTVPIREWAECGDGLELRPCPPDGYLLVGCGLCGGRAYAMLEQFYRQAAGTDEPRYDRMLAQATEFVDRFGADAAWRVRTTFSGTRADPDALGGISGIGIHNFTPGALTAGVVRGILEELKEQYDAMRAFSGMNAAHLVGSGNGLRKNPLMRRFAEALFGLPLSIPAHKEEAAFGAALHAMAAAGRVASLDEARSLIRYE